MAPGPVAAVTLMLVSATHLAAAAAEAAARKPHIVLILADDYGWGALGVHRRGSSDPLSKQAQAEVHTPNLDALVDAGIHLERHYAYKICSPSRSSLQSGRLATNVNAKNTGVSVQNPLDPVSGYQGIPRNMTGLAKKLHGAGYRTHAVGKWDAGMATPEHTPQGRGYESWLGYFQHANDYWRKSAGLMSLGEVDNCLGVVTDLFEINSTYRGGVRDVVSLSSACKQDLESDPGCYEEHLFRERAISVIKSHDTSKVDAPLFLFHSFHLMHTPLEVPKVYLEKIDEVVRQAGAKPIDSQNRRLFAAMLLYLDESVGKIIQALHAKDMWDDTLIIFAADNGGAVYEPGSGNNHPLKGGKYSDWEGGVRTTAFVSGGFVPQAKRGTSHTGVISIADWYGTLCELAGVDSFDDAAHEANKWLKEHSLPLLPPVDSVAQWGFILNGTNGRPEPLHLSEQGLLHWPYKLVTGKQPYSAWTGALFPNCTTVEHFKDGQGPDFDDFKIFDQKLACSPDPAISDRRIWTQDCAGGCLFNVEEDPTEHLDLSKDPNQAQRLQVMQRALAELNKGIFEPHRGQMQLAACLNAIEIGGYYGPFHATEGWYSPVPAPTASKLIKDFALLPLLHVANKPGVQSAIVEKLRPWVPEITSFAVHDKCFEHSSPDVAADASSSTLIERVASEVHNFMGSVGGDPVVLI